MSALPPRGRVLVLAPHPDDETLGCGGAIVLHRRRGDPVAVAFATDGEAGDRSGVYDREVYARLRRREAAEAATVLGVRDIEFWGLPDGRLSGSRALAPRVEEALRRLRPAVVYRPAADDPHPDHRALARSFERALRGRRPRPVDLRYEVCYLPPPGALLDVGSAFPAKLRALRRYRSQLRCCDYLASARETARCRSMLLPGSRWAESFR